MTDAPLSGFTVGVTAARRAEELSAMLRRKGAAVLAAPAMRTVPLEDDPRLSAASRALVRRPADVVVVTTGAGFSGWVAACESQGMGAELLAGMARGRVVARGPKAVGAVRAAGLQEEWFPPGESSTEVLDYLRAGGVRGARVAVQLHGDPMAEFRAALRAAGAEVVQVPVYRWTEPEDVAPLDGLIAATVAGELDAVTFTSAPAASGLLSRGATTGAADSLVAALGGDVLAMCVGPVTAGPLTQRGVSCVWPERGRTGAMVRKLCAELAPRG